MAFFRPEFFNRLDAVVTFHPLGPETIRAITRKELAAIAAREGLARAGITVRWTDRLVEHLAAVGFDARYGAPAACSGRSSARWSPRWRSGC